MAINLIQAGAGWSWITNLTEGILVCANGQDVLARPACYLLVTKHLPVTHLIPKPGNEQIQGTFIQLIEYKHLPERRMNFIQNINFSKKACLIFHTHPTEVVSN
jgi:hypothetical protein